MESASQQPDAAQRTVIVYAEPLLSSTMTFVRSQGLALSAFAPVFVGPRHLDAGLELPEGRVVVIREQRNGAGRLARLREVPFKVLGYDPFFFRRVKRFEPVLLHAHFGPAALTALPLAHWLNVPMVVTFHGYDATVTREHMRHARRQARVYVQRKAELRDGAQQFIAVSKFIKGRLLEQGFPDSKIAVHYIGVDTEVFQPDAHVQREPIVLYVASLHEGKGCEYVIQAMAKVQAERPEVELVVIGEGPLRKQLERLASESLKRHRFLGSQPPEVVRRWMNRAKVFSVASVSVSSGGTEAFGLVYAEAQAMGLPVASFTSGGVPEAVAHGETGLLVQEKDWQGLAENILELLRNEALWQRMSEAGQRRVHACFNLETQTRELEQIYESVLSRHGQSSAATSR